MIEKAVVHIVLDQNGISDFTETFKYSVNEIISSLQEISELREENIQLNAICDHQEKQLLAKVETGKTAERDIVNVDVLKNTTPNITEMDLLSHKKDLEDIFNALEHLLEKGISKPMLRDDSNTTVIVSDTPLNNGLSDAIPNAPTCKPPPPPPPPMLPGMGRGPPPPPPPFGGNLKTPPQELNVPVLKFKPTTKTKKLHWERIESNQFENSIWSKLKENYNNIEEKLNKAGLFQEIESQFPIKDSKALKTKSTPVKSEDEGEIKFLSDKRAQNLMIFMGVLKGQTAESLSESIRTFDTSKLPEIILEQCLASLPTPEEEKAMVGYSTNDNFRNSEKFMFTVSQRLIQINNVLRCRERISIILFKINFTDRFNELKLVAFKLM
jgi:hypothetical protein